MVAEVRTKFLRAAEPASGGIKRPKIGGAPGIIKPVAKIGGRLFFFAG